MPESKHSSFPQLVIAIVIAVVVAVIAIPLSRVGGGRVADQATYGVAERIRPVARVEVKPVATAALGPRTAESIYAGTCSACHGTGVSGAPKKGDKAAWTPRLKAGLEALVKSAVAGKNAMPPKGGASDLSDAEIRAVIELMTK